MDYKEQELSSKRQTISLEAGTRRRPPSGANFERHDADSREKGVGGGGEVTLP